MGIAATVIAAGNESVRPGAEKLNHKDVYRYRGAESFGNSYHFMRKMADGMYRFYNQHGETEDFFHYEIVDRLYAISAEAAQ